MPEANDVVPYTHDEIVKIIAACDEIGRTSYERRRARAMMLLMRYAGLRISDVVTLSREHIQGTLPGKARGEEQQVDPSGVTVIGV